MDGRVARRSPARRGVSRSRLLTHVGCLQRTRFVGAVNFRDNGQTFDAVRTAVTMLTTLHGLYHQFEWRYDTGDAIDPYWIDKLSGSTALRHGVDTGHAPDRIVASWSGELARFAPIRARYLMYR